MSLYVGSQKVCPVIEVGVSDPTIESLSITPSTTSQTITASGGVDGYSPISVSAVTSSIDNNIVAGNIKKDVTILGVTGSYEGSAAPVLDSLTVTPTTSTQSIAPPSGVDGYNDITVNAVTSSIDSNIVAGNIKSGVTILGVSGSVTELKGETRTVSITSTSGNTFTPSSGKNGITSIKVNPTNQALTITPTTSSQEKTVPSGYSGYGTVTVNPVTSSIDSNIAAGNIKKNVTILGVTGSYEGTVPTGTMNITENGTYDVTDYASAVVEVSDTPQGENRIVVIDYDGTILKEEYLASGDTFTFPSAPTHERLNFQSWVCPLTITNNTITVPNYDVYIGPTYTTKSGLNEFDIALNPTTGLIFTLNMSGTKNWGDGTSDTASSHTYPSYGNYTVTCDGTSFTSSSTSSAFGSANGTNDVKVLEVRLNTVTTLPTYCFAYCNKLRAISNTSSLALSSSSTYAFAYTMSLKALILNQATTGADHLFYNSGIRFFVSKALSNIPTYSFYYTELEGLNVSSGVTLNTFSLYYSRIKRIRTVTPASSSNSGLYGSRLSTVDIDTTVISQANFIAQSPELLTVNFTNDVSSITSANYAWARVTSSPGIFGNSRTFNFLNNTQIPSLSFSIQGSNGGCWPVALFGAAPDCLSINVPYSLLSSWKVTDVWSWYSECIKTPNPARITFSNIDSNVIVYLDGCLFDVGSNNVVDYGGSTSPVYLLYNRSTNTASSAALSSITEGSSATVTDSCTGGNKITLNTGVTGCTVTGYIGGNPAPFVEETSGKYVLNVTGSGQQININIKTPSSYNDVTASLTTTGSAITKSITLPSASYTDWTRPNLTSNVTFGTGTFSLSSSAIEYSNNPLYYAADSSTSTYFRTNSQVSGTTVYFRIYTSDKISPTSMIITFNSTSYAATNISIEGSNDYKSWTPLASTYSRSSTTGTLTITRGAGYNYHRLIMTGMSSFLGINNIAITAGIKGTTDLGAL